MRLAPRALAAALLASGLWWASPPADAGRLLRPDDPALVAEGRELYAAHCASCHGADVRGKPNWQTPGADGLLPAPPHDATGHTWHHDDRLLFDLTRNGTAAVIGNPNYRSAMPIFSKTLTDPQIVAVLSFIKSTWPADIRARHDRINDAKGN